MVNAIELERSRHSLQLELFGLCLCPSIDKEYIQHPTRRNKVCNTFFDFNKLYSETFFLSEIGEYFTAVLEANNFSPEIFVTKGNILPLATAIAKSYKKADRIAVYGISREFLKEIKDSKNICVIDDIVSEGEFMDLISHTLKEAGADNISYLTLIDCKGMNRPECLSVLDSEIIKRTGIMMSITQTRAFEHDPNWINQMKKEVPLSLYGPVPL